MVPAMSRLVLLCLTSALSLAGSCVFAHALDSRISPQAAVRWTGFSLSLPKDADDAVASSGEMVVDKSILPREYTSAMMWYRVSLADGYMQPPIFAVARSYDEYLPEPLNWAWISQNGDVVARTGRGVFKLSFADNSSNWFRDVECKLVSWPDGTTEAPMTCNDGSERRMMIPGDGIVYVDDIEYRRVFASEETTLPPEEVIDLDQVMAAAMAGKPIPRGIELPETAPLPSSP